MQASQVPPLGSIGCRRGSRPLARLLTFSLSAWGGAARRLVSEALQAVQRAEAVLWVHLGTESDQLQELREMRTCLEGLLRAAPAAAGELL